MTRHRKQPNHRHFSSCRFTTETQKHHLVLVITKSVAARKPIRSNLLFCGLSMYTINGAYGTLFVTRLLVSFLNSCIHHTVCKHCNICNMYFTPEVIKLKTVKRKGGHELTVGRLYQVCLLLKQLCDDLHVLTLLDGRSCLSFMV